MFCKSIFVLQLLHVLDTRAMSHSLGSHHCAFESLRLIKKGEREKRMPQFSIEMFVVCQTNFHFSHKKFFFEFLLFQKFQFGFSLELSSVIL